MKIKVLEERTFIVPRSLKSEVRGAIDIDHEYLDELLGDMDSHGCVDHVRTISVTIDGKTVKIKYPTKAQKMANTFGKGSPEHRRARKGR